LEPVARLRVIKAWNPQQGKGSTMMQLAALSLTAALLAGCAGSSRIDGIAPGWSNTHTGTVESRGNRAPVRSGGADTDARGAVNPQAAPARPAPGEE
jgi:hypothetical protein